MRLSDYLRFGTVLHGAIPHEHREVIGALLSSLAALGHLPRAAVRTLHEALLGRERLGSTAIGGGLALPHIRHAAVTRPLGALAVSQAPVEWESIDGEPVHVVVLHLAPPVGPTQHLGTAGMLAPDLLRTLQRADFLRRLRQAHSDEEISALLWDIDGGMSESDWLSCPDPLALLGRLRGTKVMTERAARRFACACCRRMWHRLPEGPARRAAEAAERCARGELSVEELPEHRRASEHLAEWGEQGPIGPLWEAGWFLSTYGGAMYCADDPDAGAVLASAAAEDTAEAVLRLCLPWATALGLPPAVQADLLRDVVPPPYGPVRFEESWREWQGGEVRRLAEAIDQDQAFDLLPVLGDALEEAGCPDARILNHCRSARPHVPGCWVVRGVRGKD
jgi:mannitol/fructose-specific phosphotransferase system IIA component (Ntr-type)